jgi:MerR family transcriptional regulator, mercuric resistance operon regulatory protein
VTIRTPRPLTIGDVARRTGVNIETVRYYERIGLLPKPTRTEGGHRAYDEAALKRLAFVRRSRDLGFTLDDIRALLSLVAGGFTCGEVRTLTEAHLANVKRKIADLRRMQKALSGMVAECRDGTVPECPIIDVLFSGGPRSERQPSAARA